MFELSWNATKRAVYLRAHGCCEYCRACEENTGLSMEVEHINPNGGDSLENLRLSCSNCNGSKAIAIKAPDPLSGEIVPLFNPRQERWSAHFLWSNNWTNINGITATGRATVLRLKMNMPRMIKARQRWVMAGFHPPIND